MISTPIQNLKINTAMSDLNLKNMKTNFKTTTKTKRKVMTTKTFNFVPILVLTLAFSLISNSCNFVKKETESIQDTVAEYTGGSPTFGNEHYAQYDALVFVRDQSGSIQNGEEENLRLKKYLKKSFFVRLTPKTDLILMQVDNFSGAPTNRIVIPYEEPITNGAEDLGDNETLKTFEKQNAEKRGFRKMEHNFYNKFFSEPLFKKSSRTCILDLIPQLEKQVANYGSVNLYFYSDMLEDSGYRVMINSLADSKNTAEEMADEDLKKLEMKYGKPEGGFSHVKNISIIIPTHTYPDKLDILQFYWKRIFESLGFKGKILWERLPE